MIVYVAGPYNGPTDENITDNIDAACKIGVELWEMGHVAIVPHLNTAHFERFCNCTTDDYLTGDLKILARCDAMVMTPDWERSKGACGEYQFAEGRGIPIYVYPDLPTLNATEETRPVQAAAFIDVIMQMYRVHLQKNADYSPANIKGTGEIGLTTRLWDKMARLMNLTGFRIEIASSSYEKPVAPKNESVDDNLLDLATYGVIGFLLRKGAWGR